MKFMKCDNMKIILILISRYKMAFKLLFFLKLGKQDKYTTKSATSIFLLNGNLRLSSFSSECKVVCSVQLRVPF